MSPSVDLYLADALAQAGAVRPLPRNPVTIGPAVLFEQFIPPGHYSADVRASGGRETISLMFLASGSISWTRDRSSSSCHSGDVLVVDGADGGTFVVGEGAAQTILSVPKLFLAPILPSRFWNSLVPASATWGVVHELLRSFLVFREPELLPQAAEWGLRSLTEALSAAVATSLPPADALQARRDAQTLDRLIAHIDSHLGAELAIADLCRELGCSRSTLYRVAASAGGIAELVARRRLIAIYHLLGDIDETRSIAVLAATHGFSDPSQFNRRFKKFFGTTAGRVRISSRDE